MNKDLISIHDLTAVQVAHLFDLAAAMKAKPGDYRKATQRIYHAPDKASFIELPIVTP